jgi:putative intracellular protease/amidase
LKETHKLADVKESDYDAVFYPGGHGPLWDLATDKKFNRFNCRFYSNNKPVVFAIHQEH